MTGHVFIFHSTEDAAFITALRQALEAYGSQAASAVLPWRPKRPDRRGKEG